MSLVRKLQSVACVWSIWTLAVTNGYVSKAPLGRANVFSSRMSSSFYDPGELSGGNAGENKDAEDARLFASLRQRAQQLDQASQQLAQKWKKGDCKSTTPLVLPDWVRRIDVDYPLVACGSARETVFVGHLETGKIIAWSPPPNDENAKESSKDDEEGAAISDVKLQETLRILYGNYDGGGTLSIAFSKSLICEGGRQGGVRIWRINGASTALVSQGSIPALHGILATCLCMDNDQRRLYVGTHTGQVHAYRLDQPTKPLALQTKPHQVWQFGASAVLSLHLCPEYACGVAALAGGSVQLFSTQLPAKTRPMDKGNLLASLYPPFDSTERRAANIYPSQATFVHTTTTNGKDDGEKGLSIVCGGSDGSLYSQEIAMITGTDGTLEVDVHKPFQTPIQPLGPGHAMGRGLVKAMASPMPNVVATFGQDGCIKVWDMVRRRPFYQFAGYKVWAGSLWTDGRRLLSDGVDNTIVLHDFAESESNVG